MKEEQYKHMVEAKKQESHDKVIYAIRTIKECVTNGEAISASYLARKTGLSRSFFYNNEEVKTFLLKALKSQRGQDFETSKRPILDKALKAKMTKLELENQKLKDINQELKQRINDLNKIITNFNLAEYERLNPYV